MPCRPPSPCRRCPSSLLRLLAGRSQHLVDGIRHFAPALTPQVELRFAQLRGAVVLARRPFLALYAIRLEQAGALEACQRGIDTALGDVRQAGFGETADDFVPVHRLPGSDREEAGIKQSLEHLGATDIAVSYHALHASSARREAQGP